MKPIASDELVYGSTPEPGLLAVEHVPGPDSDAFELFLRAGGNLSTRIEPFSPFLWLTKPDWLDGFEPRPDFVRLAGDNPYRFLARFPSWALLERALAHLRKSTRRPPSDPAAPYFFLRDPAQQFLLDTGRTFFHNVLLPDLRFLFLDLETDCAPNRDFSNPDRDEDRILSIALSDGSGPVEIIDGRDLDEKSMLSAFVESFLARDPDVVVGHNLFKFDLPYLETRARRRRVPLPLGRNGAKPDVRAARFNAAERVVSFPRVHFHGRHVVDTYLLALLYDASHRAMEGHGLKAVARHFGVAAPNRTLLEGPQIARAFRDDHDAFLRYAADDVRETAAICPILLAAPFAQSQILPCPLESACIRGNAGKIESLLLREYHRQRHSIPAPSPPRPFEGAYADLFYQGLARDVHHCDVRSLYPSILLREKRNPLNDPLGVFLLLLGRLRDFRLQARRLAADPSLPPAESGRWNALQTAFKILINSFYGYLAFPQALFNDFDLAALVAERGRDVLRSMVDRLRSLGANPVEIDTDGIYFTPPRGLSSDDLERFQANLRSALPPGIEVDFDGRFPAMFSYKTKNYALLAEDGSVLIKGAALKSRGLEPYLRDFLREWLTLALLGRSSEIPAMLARRRDDVALRRLPVSALAKTEMLSVAPSAYLKKREAGGKSRQPAYEVAIASGRLFQAGDAVSYYVVGAKKHVPVHSHAKLASAFDPAQRDENVPYYLAKLDALAKKLDSRPSQSQPANDDQPTLF